MPDRSDPYTATEIAQLPNRIYTSEVCRVARYSITKLWRERKAGRMPEPIARGRQDIFDRDSVLQALRLPHDEPKPEPDPWSVNPDAIRQARAGHVRHAAPPKRRDVRVFFQVPARLQPSGWLSLIPLPIEGDRKGDLNDADEVARIQADAAALYRKLQADRNPSTEIEPGARSIPTLNRLWQMTQGFKNNKPRTQRNYATAAGLIEAWSASVNHPPVASMRATRSKPSSPSTTTGPTTKKQILTVLKLMMAYAVKLKWRVDNPADDIKVRIPKSRVAIWEASGRRTVRSCLHGRWPSLDRSDDLDAVGDRPTPDRRVPVPLRRQYSDNEGMFSFRQSKTDSRRLDPHQRTTGGAAAGLPRRRHPVPVHQRGDRPAVARGRAVPGLRLHPRYPSPRQGRAS
jgi:hypothetical protein